MIIKAAFKVTGTTPNLSKVLGRSDALDFSYEQSEDCTLINVSVPSLQVLGELKRRLGGKRGRPNTTVEIVKMEQIQDGSEKSEPAEVGETTQST